MAEPIENKVMRSLKAAEELYHRLVLIVGKGGSGKTSVIQNLAKLHDAEPININLCLSKELLELTRKTKAIEVVRNFGAVCQRQRG
jgi:Zeta toxin.